MTQQRDVVQANALFYNAFNHNDLDLMKKVWLNDDEAICIHPGWGVLKGFSPIIRSWADIFEAENNLEIKLSHVNVMVGPDLAWVGCQENLFSIMTTGVQASKVHASNVFRQVNGDWKMVLHHASSVPGLPREEPVADS